MVLAAINPIEQANRARDAKYKADGSQLLAALDRYYVSTDQYPWMVGTTLTVDTAINFTTAAAVNMGICLTAACTGTSGQGYLVSNNELKSEFMNRDFVTKTLFSDLLYIGKELGSASSVYICYVPKSKSERSKATKTLTTTSPTLGTVAAADCGNPAVKTYATLASSCVTCLPQ